MNKLVEARAQAVADPESQAIYNAFRDDMGFEKMMKFNKGSYFVDGEEVPLGTQFTAHAIGAAKTWVKFVEGEKPERKVYRGGQIPPDRDQLPDQDQSKWSPGLDGRPKDPWVLQSLLPLEDEQGNVNIFVASSFGGKRAVGDLVGNWARRRAKQSNCGQPIVKLRKMMMPSKKFGDIPRPHFEIVGWDDVREGIREVKAENLKDDDMNDDIPF